MNPKYRKLWIGIGMLALLVPAGIIIPDLAGSGPAWGEWANDEISALVGYVPRGMEKMSDLWKGLIPDYSFGGDSRAGAWFGYIASAFIGILLVVAATLGLGRLLTRGGRDDS
jgi:hypothetical protein